MNSKLILSTLLLATSLCSAHHIPAVNTINFNIQDSHYSHALYDLTHGTVQYTEANGSRKRYAKAHMARIAPWNAQEVIGKIMIDLGNEFAGAWYIYR
jgi:hypothetical protein